MIKVIDFNTKLMLEYITEYGTNVGQNSKRNESK